MPSHKVASWHRNPRIKFLGKGAIKNGNENEITLFYQTAILTSRKTYSAAGTGH